MKWSQLAHNHFWITQLVSHLTGHVYWMLSSGNPSQLLNIQDFSKSYEILDEKNPSWEEVRHHAASWHQCASCGAAACSGGTQEKELALWQALVAGRRHLALCPYSAVEIISTFTHSFRLSIKKIYCFFVSIFSWNSMFFPRADVGRHTTCSRSVC